MATAAGTLERLAQQLAQALQPLEQRLAPDQAPGFLSELGIGLPADVAGAGSLTAAVAAAASETAKLASPLAALIAAIAADNAGQILSTGAQLIAQIEQTLGAFGQVGPALRNAVSGASGLSAAQIAALQAAADALPQRLADYALVEYLRSLRPQAVPIVSVTGLIDDEPVAGALGDSTAPPFKRRALHLDRLMDLVFKPNQYLQETFGWGAPDFDGSQLLPKVAALIEASGVPTVMIKAPGQPTILEAFVLRLAADPTKSPPALDARVRVGATQDFTESQPINDTWSFSLGAQARFDAGLEISVQPPLDATLVPPTGTASIQATLGLQAKHMDGSPLLLIGETGGSRLAAQSLSAGLGFSAAWTGAGTHAAPTLSADITGGKVVIDTSNADGFIAAVTSGVHVEADFDFHLTWQPDIGVRITGGSQLQLTVPLNVDLGPLEFSSLYLVGGLSGQGVSLEISAALGVTLGPIAATVDRIGVLAQLALPGHGGNLGPADLSVAFKPPSGLGIRIDAGLVAGGGYISFDPAKGRYAGVLDVAIAEIIQVKVIGVLDTKLPDGSSGFSFLLIITFDLPPIQLGFGFTLNGVGGLGGVNRTMVLDALRTGLRNHQLNNVLFPPDPIANAPQIISDIEAFFPPQQGRYLFGPMLALGWGTPTLLEFEVGVILEVPDPVRLAILGLIRASIPAPDLALISLKIDVLGTIDFGLEKLAIDGTMYDSYIIEFQLAGDMALRFNWGSNADFLFSLGGFNPHFQPPPDVPQLNRLSVSLGVGNNPRLSSNSYLAVTSNSLQFGANVDAYAAAGGFAVHGWIGFDTLFIFSPFAFEIDFSAGFDVSFEGESLAGIQLDATLSGPRPFHLHGDASLHILFFSVHASLDLSWGDSTPAKLPSLPVLPPLTAALSDARNWSVILPPQTSQSVSLRQLPNDPTQLTVHPMGALRVRETVVPLDIPITLFNNATPADGNEFAIESVLLNTTPAATAPYQEQFAIGQFTTLSDADKLSTPSYEPFDAGLTIGSAAFDNGDDAPRDVVYQERYIDDYGQPSRFGSIYRMPAAIHAQLAASGACASSAARTTGLRSFVENGMTSALDVKALTYTIASTADLSVRADLLPAATTRYGAATTLAAHFLLHPDERDALQVLPLYEAAYDR
jgi:hypothetical protein